MKWHRIDYKQLHCSPLETLSRVDVDGMGQISQEGALRLLFQTYWRGVVSYFVAMHLRRLKRKSAS